ncbi:MAG: threonylcarbamoyl-AMP synthase [SAR324 cluster bacterium]|uniref:L-threonylcarbamoyladenylate synthase n=1 Tax=SAR324 cluster bacterium TaxID=2024889 RepID=A0A2A4T7C8_9DELT|nr:MAG: threonylcarbamoyl-AMP synthase [SAR324 cluster bacterium]
MQIVPYPFPEEGKEVIKKSLIRQQGNVIFPTETFYAVGCLANTSTAVKHVYRLKKRAKDQPLLVLVDSWEMFETYAGEITPSQRTLLEKYWPGALTAIIPSRGKLAKELNYTGESLAFRMTSSPIARDLIRLVGVPIVGTSANCSGEKEINDFSVAYKKFGDHVELYIDGGKTPGGLPSTIISMVDTDHYTLLRQGVVTLDDK